MSEKLQEILTDLRNSLTELYGERLERLVLFGSQARGDAEADSDIDVLVVLKGDVNGRVERKRTNRLIADISLQYHTVLFCVFVSDLRYRNDKEEPLLVNIRREGVRI